ncbi:hypothetical protein LCGC14_2726740, partial [marine sediment metagenome]
CKPLDVSEALLATVRNALRQRKLVAERERLNGELADSNARMISSSEGGSSATASPPALIGPSMATRS